MGIFCSLAYASIYESEHNARIVLMIKRKRLRVTIAKDSVPYAVKMCFLK